MEAVLALVTMLVPRLAQIAAAGVEVADLYTQTRAVIDANVGPGNDAWNALDLQFTAAHEAFLAATGV